MRWVTFTGAVANARHPTAKALGLDIPPTMLALGPGFSVKMAVVPCADFEQAVDCQYMFGATKRHS